MCLKTTVKNAIKQYVIKHDFPNTIPIIKILPIISCFIEVKKTYLQNTKINAAAIRAEKNLFQIFREKIEQK
jgi:hypothetical protein